MRRQLLGLVVSIATVAVATAAVYPLKRVAPYASLSVVYLPAVLLAAAFWGLPLGLLTALGSAAAFNFFHLPPVGQFTVADSRNWVALAAFTIVAVVVGAIAELARHRATEADQRRREADLAAALARTLLAGSHTKEALGPSARLVADALGLSSAAIQLGAVAAGPRRRAYPLCGQDGEQLATLLVPRQLRATAAERLSRQIVPALEALLAIALRRDALQAEAVETAALRRSNDLKTALLRSVSHDLRTPLTAVLTAGHALASGSLKQGERLELAAAVVEEGERLASLIDKLLDLSKLEAGRAAPHPGWVSIEEVLLAARETAAAADGRLRTTVEEDLPELLADAAQLERAFANLIENARRYSGGQPVHVHARRLADRVTVAVVDRGPGIPPAERERIFEPFYRGPATDGPRSPGAGLGLAIAKGFVEANGGSISVQSLPGQGTSFLVSLPVAQAGESRAATLAR